MKGRSPVEQYGVLADDLFQEVPDLRPMLLDHFFGRLDGRCQTHLLELVVNEGLEELQRHPFGKPTLMELQLGADHDDRTPGIIDSLSKQVLTKTALLPLQGIG